MKRLFIILFPLCLCACSIIDDDLSMCGEELVIDYQVQLHTELDLQLQTDLSLTEETPVREALQKLWEPIFTDKAKDIDLRFFLGSTDILKYRIQEVINDNRSSYTIRLPKDDYMHLALANIADNRQVHLSGADHAATMILSLPESGTVSPLNTGVFTARLPMNVNDTVRRFDVHLYMVTAAVALVIDTTLCDSLESLSSVMNGSACTFAVQDSVFSYARPCVLKMEDVPVGSGQGLPRKAVRGEQSNLFACQATVGLPTQDDQSWTITCVATLEGNRHTTSTLTIAEPLKAGTLRIIKLTMEGNGAVKPNVGQQVGATVTLDWKSGGEHEIEI